MESVLLDILPNLSVGLAAILVLYLSFRRFVKSMENRDKAFRSYVQENNHRVTELVVEATNAIKESTKAIKKSSEAIHSSTETIKDMRNVLFKRKGDKK